MDRTDADAGAELALKGVTTPQIIKTESGRQFLVLPSTGGSATAQDVTERGAMLSPEPKWIEQSVTVQTTDSLVEYLNRFKGGDTSLFADIENNRIVAVLDYHGSETAARGVHQAALNLPFSVEWGVWTGIDGKMMGQLEFARFLEENAADISAPAAADLLEVCRDLQANRKVNFTKAVRTASDNENFEYTDETTATTRKGGIEIPSQFQLRIPVYFGGQTYAIAAFLRWRVEEGEGLKLGVKLHNREHVRQAVFRDVVMEAAENTGLPAYFGRI